MKRFVILTFLAMSVVVWGLLEKSQIDDETIEEAINRLIGEHEADEAAHLGSGQSLASHKASVIIDHVVRSVVRDKLAFDRFQIDEHFATIDAWGKSAGVAIEYLGEMYLMTTGASGNSQYAYAQPGDSMQEGGANANSPIWETRVKLSSATNQTVYIIHGDPDAPMGYGFKIVNGTVYAVWWDASSVEHTQALAGVTVTDYNRYRVEFEYGVAARFYVNGVLKHTETGEIGNAAGNFIYYKITADAAAVKTMYVQSLHYDEDYST